MKRLTTIELATFVFLVVAGVVVRLSFQHIPNFAPVAALALFSGYVFRSSLLAAAVPLSVMLISDYFIGGYDLRIMAIIYTMMVFPICLRGFARRNLSLEQEKMSSTTRSVLGLITCSAITTLGFFFVSNFAVWLFANYYETTFAGLCHCYARALPFFRFTFASDLIFSSVLFTGYALAMHAGLVSRKSLVAAPVMNS